MLAAAAAAGSLGRSTSLADFSVKAFKLQLSRKKLLPSLQQDETSSEIILSVSFSETCKSPSQNCVPNSTFLLGSLLLQDNNGTAMAARGSPSDKNEGVRAE